MLPLREHGVAMTVANLAQKLAGSLLGRAVTQRIHTDADRQSSQRIVLGRPSQDRTLAVQPPNVAKKAEYQECSSADSNANLIAGKRHSENESTGLTENGKITCGSRDGTCTSEDSEFRASEKARRESRASSKQKPNYSFLSSSLAASTPPSCCACASASSMAFLASAIFLERASARFSRFSSRTFSLPSSSRKALSAPSPLFQPVRMMRVYPPLPSPKRGPTLSNSFTTASSVIR